MKKKILTVTFVFLATLTFLGLIHSESQAAVMPFSVEAVIPENQIDHGKSYFDLQMTPGQIQTLTVKMKNDTANDVTVEVHPNAAMTNDNGVVEYSDAKPKFDKTMKYPFSDLAKTETDVTIPAKSTINKKIKVTMPAQSYDGFVIGGIYFQEKIDEKSEKKSEGNVQIRNRYAYVIGVSLMETSNSVKPNMELLSVKPGQVNYRNVLKVNLQNPTMVPIKKLKIDGKVYTKNGKEVIHNALKPNLTMAPNTNFNFGINWNNKEFKPGTYRLEMTATSGEHRWHWKQYFTINGAEAKKLNKRAIQLEKDYTMWYILAAVIFFLLLLLIIILLMRRKHKKEQESAIEKAKRELMAELEKGNNEE